MKNKISELLNKLDKYLSTTTMIIILVLGVYIKGVSFNIQLGLTIIAMIICMMISVIMFKHKKIWDAIFQLIAVIMGFLVIWGRYTLTISNANDIGSSYNLILAEVVLLLFIIIGGTAAFKSNDELRIRKAKIGLCLGIPLFLLIISLTLIFTL